MYKLLIVDDEPTELKFLRYVINQYNLPFYICGEGKNGDEAIELAKKHIPDFIIMDIHMPIKNGLEAATIIKNKYPHIKIYLLTAYEYFEYAQTAIKIDIEDYLTKPISPQHLVKVLKKGIRTALRERLETYKNNRVNRQVELIKPVIKKQLVYNLISGNNVMNNVMAQQIIGFKTSKPKSVIVISIFDRNKTIINNYKKVEALTRKIENGIGIGLYTVLADYEAVIFTRKSSLKTIKNTLEAISKKHNFKFTAGIEPIYSNENIIDAYKVANSVRKTAIFWQECGLYSLNDFNTDNNYPNLVILQRNILELLLNKRNEEILKMIKKMFQDFKNKRYFSEHVMAFTTNLFTLLLFETSNVINSDQPKLLRNIIFKYEEITTITELYELIRKFIYNLSDYITSSNLTSAEQSVKFAVEYINQNYNQNINLDKVAGELFLSSCYLSRIFKKYTGEGFTSYLTKIRIEKAQQLLLTGKYTVSEVAKKVGYEDPSYFSSIFKKFTEATPSQIINLARQKS